VNAGVDELITHGNKILGVRLEGGDEVHAPLVISSAGVINTFGKFLRNSQNIKNYDCRLKTVTPTPSYVCLYMGLKISPENLQKKNTNLWIYPGYNHDKNVENFLHNSSNDFPVLYISFPAAKDPEYQKKYPGYSTMEAIIPSPFEDFDKWKDMPWQKRGPDYDKFKEEISQRILKEVYKHVPAAKESLDYYELSTPLSVRSLANYQKGEMYGLDHTPDRFHQRWLRPQTDIKNLYLTGQDILTVGATSALFSGLITASSILKKNLMSELMKN
jgi:all-trans-retinol 13,14-reductase